MRKKSKWFFAEVHENCNDESFKLGNAIDHEWCNTSHLGVKLVIKRNALVVDVNNRIGKFNSSAL